MSDKNKKAKKPTIKQGDVMLDPKTNMKHVCFIADKVYAVFAPVVIHKKGGYKTMFKNIFVLSSTENYINVIGKVKGLDIVLTKPKIQ